MLRPVTHFTFLFLVILIFSFIGCTGENYGKLRSTNQISGKELQQNWNGYTVYYQPYYALLYKINNDRKIDLGALNKALQERGSVLSNGYGKLKGQTFRIAHMGDCTMNDLNELLGWIDEILPDLPQM